MQGDTLWEPTAAGAAGANITKYSEWLSDSLGKEFSSYEELWRWSVSDLEGFWGSVWDYFEVGPRPDGPALATRTMPGAQWFPAARVNLARHVFRTRRDGPALTWSTESGDGGEVSWAELERRVGSAARAFRDAGVAAGDVVAGLLPNSPDAVVGFLASASMGAVWTCAAPEFGPSAVLDRFRQAAPKVFLTVEGYDYGGKRTDRSADVDAIVRELPSVSRVFVAGEERRGSRGWKGEPWADATRGRDSPEFPSVPFGHPLWYLYSSGTTGLPKPIVHGQGGILLEHLKALGLHNDIRAGDRFFWFTTTGWMMWNYLLGGLLHGATAVLYDGSPSFPSLETLWDLAEKARVTFMGSGAAFLSACAKAGVRPGSGRRLKALRGVGSTGSPLSPEMFEWVYSEVKSDVWLASISGGTDMCTAFVGGNPTLPVFSGEIQCRSLGAKVEAYDESGRPVVGQVGELVVTEPMPSMPLYLLGDKDGSRYAESYFGTFPGVWRHGDWIEVTERGTCVIYGRSDATVKRMGVRIGTSEIYRAVESIPEIADSLAVDLGGGSPDKDRLVLFVVTAGGQAVGPELQEKVRSRIRESLSRRYVPDVILQAPSVPRTLSGKKLEVPVKRILAGEDPERVLNRGSVQDPGSLAFYVQAARSLRGGKV